LQQINNHSALLPRWPMTLLRMQDEIAVYIDNRVAEVKVSPDRASQPAEVCDDC
jgi:hypothetical protein